MTARGCIEKIVLYTTSTELPRSGRVSKVVRSLSAKSSSKEAQVAGTSVETLLKKARPHIEIRPDLSVSALARAMEENRVWAAAVVDQGETLGLVSSVDVLFRVTAKGLDPRNTTVAQIMTPDENLVWVTPHALVEECFAIMAQHWIRDLPVFVVDQETRKRKLVGMITLLEVAEALLLYNQLIDMQKGAFLGTPEAAR